MTPKQILPSLKVIPALDREATRDFAIGPLGPSVTHTMTLAAPTAMRSAMVASFARMLAFVPPIIAVSLALPPTPNARAAAQQSVCMAKASDPAWPALVIPVPPGQVSAMTARGFAQQDCQGKQNSLPQFKKGICEFAANAPQGVQDRFLAAYGASPTELCAMANSILGN